MIRQIRFSVFIFCLLSFNNLSGSEILIRINKQGYFPNASKTGIVLSKTQIKSNVFSVYDALTNEIAGSFPLIANKNKYEKYNYNYQLDFSNLRDEGAYYIRIDNNFSPVIFISKNIFAGKIASLTNFLRSQRTEENAAAAWFANSDRQEISPGIAATVIYQLLMAYRLNPEAFPDLTDEGGNNIPDEIPDILNEAKRGIDFILKRKQPYYAADSLQRKYPSMNFRYASLTAKYASALALGSEVLGNFYPGVQDKLLKRAEDLYQTGKKFPGIYQNLTVHDPLNEESSWYDDMQLAAMQLYFETFNEEYLKDVLKYGTIEPVPQWLFSGEISTWEWYPFVNFSTSLLIGMENPEISKTFRLNLKSILQRANMQASDDVFGVGISNTGNQLNKLTALHNLCCLYRSATKDNSFQSLEESLFNWIMGCNPTGKNFLPGYCNYEDNTSGDVNGEESVNLSNADGSSLLQFLLAQKLKNSGIQTFTDKNEYLNGGINRLDRSKKQIALIFICHEYSDGYQKIIKTLDKNGVKATFFVTSDFIRKPGNKNKIKSMVKYGHNIGSATAHYKLLADWNRPEIPKIRKQSFLQDLRDNYLALKEAGVSKKQAPFFFPPFELYNDSIIKWCSETGLIVVRSTPGTLANQDYTFPEMRENYYSSREIFENIIETEANQGLNGYILQFNFGTNSARKDKFYNSLGTLITTLKRKGYNFTDLYDATGLVTKPLPGDKK